MAGATVRSNGKSLFAVMAGTTQFTFFHVSHGNATPDWSGIVTTLATKTSAIHVRIMAEHCIPDGDAIGNGARGTMMTLVATFFSSYVKSLFAIMTGSARFAFFHFSHRIGTLLGEIKNCTVADSAVLVLGKMSFMAKDYVWSVLKVEPDVLGMSLSCHQHDNSRCKEGDNTPVHLIPPEADRIQNTIF